MLTANHNGTLAADTRRGNALILISTLYTTTRYEHECFPFNTIGAGNIRKGAYLKTSFPGRNHTKRWRLMKKARLASACRGTHCVQSRERNSWWAISGVDGEQGEQVLHVGNDCRKGLRLSRVRWARCGFHWGIFKMTPSCRAEAGNMVEWAKEARPYASLLQPIVPNECRSEQVRGTWTRF